MERRTSTLSAQAGSQETAVSHTLRDGQGRAPLVPQNVQADAAVGVDVGVVDAGGEVDLRGLEGVVGGEVNSEEEDAAGVGRVALVVSVSAWGRSRWLPRRRVWASAPWPRLCRQEQGATYGAHDSRLPVKLLSNIRQRYVLDAGRRRQGERAAAAAGFVSGIGQVKQG